MKHLLLLIVIISNTRNITGQCTGCTITVSSSSSTSYNLNTGQKLCITGGTFTGNIDFNGGALCIGPGTLFRAGTININGNCTIDNYGDFYMANGFNVNNGTVITNDNRMRIDGNVNFNGAGRFFNKFPKTLIFNSSIAVSSNGEILNKGYLFANGDLNTQAGGRLINDSNSKTYITGSMNVGGYNRNNGYIRVKEFININSNSDITNECSYVSDKGININGSTFNNNGFLVVTNTTGNELFRINGGATLFQNNIYSIVSTPAFENGGTVVGRGKLRANTSTNGGSFGNDGLSLTFYDPTISTAGRTFDIQNTNPHSSVNRNPVANYDSAYAINVCNSNNLVLAAALLEFKAIKVNTTDILNWQTTNQGNIVTIEIEQSKSGSEFEKIKTFQTATMVGQVVTYTYQVNHQLQTTYYRLKLIAGNGVYYYSDVQKTQGKPLQDIFTYNPYNNTIQLYSNQAIAQPAVVLIYNQFGQLLNSTTVSVLGYKMLNLQQVIASKVVIIKATVGKVTQSKKYIMP